MMNQSVLQPLPVEQLQHPEARWLIAYWRSKSPDGDLPAYRNFDGHETRSVAPHLMVVEGPPLGGSQRYVSVGSAILDRFRFDLSGLPLDTRDTDWSVLIRQAAEARRPAAGRGHLPGSHDAWIRFEILALPFADDGGDDSIIVVGLFFSDR